MIDDDLLAVLAPLFAPALLIFAHGNGPRPVQQYVTMRIENAHKLPEHVGRTVETGPAPAFGTRGNDAHRSGQIEFQCFGAGSFDVLDVAMQRLGEESFTDASNARELAFATASNVVNEPALRDGLSYEPRAIATLAFAYTRRTNESIGFIETVNAIASVGDLPDMPIHATIVDN